MRYLVIKVVKCAIPGVVSVGQAPVADVVGCLLSGTQLIAASSWVPLWLGLRKKVSGKVRGRNAKSEYNQSCETICSHG